MNIAARIGIAAAGIAGMGVLAGCAARNENKSAEDVVDDLISRGATGYDRNGDRSLDLGTETTREEPGSEQQYLYDSNGDGFLGFGDASISRNYLDRYTLKALATDADARYGNLGTKPGVAEPAEMAKLVQEFDTGPKPGDAKDKAIAGNNILERSEIKRFNDSRYDEKYLERVYR